MIVIVDTDEKLGRQLERMLRYTGYDAVAVATASEALSLFRMRTPSLVIFELDLPAMSGMILLKTIRNDHDFDSIPMVVYTSVFTPETYTEAMRVGADAYLVKGTVGWEAISLKVEELLSPGKGRLRLTQ